MHNLELGPPILDEKGSGASGEFWRHDIMATYMIHT